MEFYNELSEDPYCFFSQFFSIAITMELYHELSKYRYIVSLIILMHIYKNVTCAIFQGDFYKTRKSQFLINVLKSI